MTARVLLIEDDRDIAELVAMYLDQDGIEAVITDTGEAGLEAFLAGSWDLVVLDINLPGMDGFEVLSEIRKASEIPVVILSARRDDVDVVYGLGIGADDFVTKPFSPKVLVARIRARIRRSRGAGQPPADGKPPEVFRFGPYLLDPENFSLKRRGERVSLAPKELELLTYLARRGGRPSTPEEIYTEVWGNEYGEVATVAVHIQRLRKKIEENPSDPRYVRTVHGYGYAFNREALE
ncbi:MAG: response regulator transcription factor [Spirochaetaceae bacterium]